MISRTFTRLGGASVIVLGTMVACSTTQADRRPALASTQASDVSARIGQALASRDFAHALLDAEKLVEAQPRAASARSLLGRAYLANGRYASARTAFEDAMTLGAEDPRTIISLALVRTALGSPDSARALLSAHIDHLPASDYGLAMAMAGDAREGVRALLEATHSPDADAQTRQNLAYALALGGEWGQARLVAGQDLSGTQLQQRMAQWAANAQIDAYPQRIASFLGVSARPDDAGLPARLALSNSEPTSMAAAQPLKPADLAAEAAAQAAPVVAPPAPSVAPAEQAEAKAAVPAAAPAPAPAPVAPLGADTAFAAPVPLIRASTDPMREAVMQRADHLLPQPKPATVAAFARSQGALLARTVTPGSDWVVQIGAYADAKIATAAWTRAKGKSLESRGYRKVIGTIALNGRTYHRLAMSGFGDRAAAVALCNNLRAQGQNCFVRHDESVAADIRMAHAAKAKPEKAAVLDKPRTIAAR